MSLGEHQLRHWEAMFFVRAKGRSMVGAGIYDGDLLVVDKSRHPASGGTVIAVMDGELAVKRRIKSGERAILRPENLRLQDIELKDGQECITQCLAQVWAMSLYRVAAGLHTGMQAILAESFWPE